MPFRSKAQERWMFATKPEMAKRWASETSKNANLPNHVGAEKVANAMMKGKTGKGRKID